MATMTQDVPRGPWRAIAAALGAALAVVVVVLAIQHARHGWPFSLHHGVGAAAPPPPPGQAAAGAPAADPHAAHARVPVQLGEAELALAAIRTEPVRRETIARPLRTVAVVVPDESRVSHIHTRVAGWIERLHIESTGQKVRAGQRIAEIFSQELLASQTEYLAARRAATGGGPTSAVVEGARARLRVLGMTEREIRRIEARGEPDRLVSVVAPRGGVVLRRAVNVGTAVDPSTEIATIADLSRVWVVAEVPESAVPDLDVGTPATLSFPGSGQPPIEAKVSFVYPTLSERTRTLRVRFEVPSDGALRPGLYGTADFAIAPREALTVGRDAVVDTGFAQHVFVATGPGAFEPRPVTLGVRVDGRVEVTSGVVEGELVVSSGVFLLDSESRLRASGGGGGHGGHGGHGGGGAGAPAPAPAAPADPHAGHGAPAAPPTDPHAGH